MVEPKKVGEMVVRIEWSDLGPGETAPQAIERKINQKRLEGWALAFAPTQSPDDPSVYLTFRRPT